MEKHRENFSFLSNLTNIASLRYNPHHGATTFLTSVDPTRTPGREFHNGISCDQVAARHLGINNRYASLELTTNEHPAGRGTGLSLAWDEKGKSIYGESDPLKVFHRLFAAEGSSIEATRAKIQHERSVLDAVLGDAKSLSKRLNSEDRAKTDQYFDLVRHIETGLNREDQWLDRPKPAPTLGAPEKDVAGTAGAEMMFDLMTAAFQADTTRVVTYQLPLASLLADFGKLTGNRVSPHRMTHFGSTDTSEYKGLIWRDQKLCELFGGLLDRLSAVTESDGSTLLDNTLVVMGSDIRTGHTRKNVPILLGGGQAGGIQQGHHRVYKEDESKLSDLWLSMLQFAGCPVDSFADSTGGLTDIFA